MSETSLNIIIFIITFLIGGGLWYFWQYYKSWKKNVEPFPEETEPKA